MAFSQTVARGVTLSRESFANPPLELGILPFWFWNGELDEKEMEWQLREYHRKGIRGIFLHGRFGLKVPYGSAAWFKKVKTAVRLAKEIGIDTWVYDEMNWPSGTAERAVLKNHPHLKQRYLELVALQVDGPLFTFLEATDNRYVNTGDSHPIAAFGCTEEEFRTEIKNPVDLTRNLSFERVIPWEAPSGKWRLLYFLEKEVPYYIDALNPEATERFIELTHDRYKQAVGSEFGKTLPGFYTDEPAMHYYHVGIDNFVVPWSSQMFKIFRKRRGYDLRANLPALYLNVGKKTAQIRYDFWRTLTEQYSETYYKRIRAWCDENGVLFTGHLLFEEWLRLHARCEGNIFKHVRHMHIIGVDHLYPKIGSRQEPDQHVALKIGSSAAHHFGSTRLLCESMGGTYWDCTLERMKWIANWEYALGVNLFNNHGYHYSIEGERKRDWPPSQFYQHTWWKYYDRFTTYMARLSHTLSGGRHVAKVLVLYPLNSIWTNYTPQARDQVSNLIESDFNWLTDALLRLHYDFDYVEEDVLAGATVTNGTLNIQDEEYCVLILPPVTHVKRSTFEVLRKFIQSGGKVIADTLLPVEFLESGRSTAEGEVRSVFGVSPAKLLSEFTAAGNAGRMVIRKRSKGNIVLFQGSGLSRAGPERVLRKILNGFTPPDVTISDEEIFYLHRRKDGHDIYFLTNTCQREKKAIEVTFERQARPELWDPNTGSVTPVHVYRVRNGRLSVTLDFPASGSQIVILKDQISKPIITETNLNVESFDGEKIVGTLIGDGPAYVKISTASGMKNVAGRPRKRLKPLTMGKDFEFKLEGDNVLTLSGWRMKADQRGAPEEEFHSPEYDDSAWLSVTNGAWEMQLPQERDEQTYPVPVWYRTPFEVGSLPRNLRLLIDGFSGVSYELYVNGARVREKGRRSSLDAEIKEVDIRPYVKKGKNLIAVRLVVNRRTDGILDPLKIIGDFTLRRGKDGYAIAEKKGTIRLGDWTKQGYPFYSGTGIYRTVVDVPPHYLEGKLVLHVSCGEDVLEVSINGSKASVLPWHPYCLDVSSLLKKGTNTIELKVTNTLINILEGVQKPSGIFSPPVVAHEHRETILVRK